jgi:hypothetical protein
VNFSLTRALPGKVITLYMPIQIISKNVEMPNNTLASLVIVSLKEKRK